MNKKTMKIIISESGNTDVQCRADDARREYHDHAVLDIFSLSFMSMTWRGGREGGGRGREGGEG